MHLSDISLEISHFHKKPVALSHSSTRIPASAAAKERGGDGKEVVNFLTACQLRDLINLNKFEAMFLKISVSLPYVSVYMQNQRQFCIVYRQCVQNWHACLFLRFIFKCSFLSSLVPVLCPWICSLVCFSFLLLCHARPGSAIITLFPYVHYFPVYTLYQFVAIVSSSLPLGSLYCLHKFILSIKQVIFVLASVFGAFILHLLWFCDIRCLKSVDRPQ